MRPTQDLSQGEMERDSQKAFSGLILHKASVPVCILHSSAPCTDHDAVEFEAWFSAHEKLHWYWLLRLCGFTLVFPQTDLDIHSGNLHILQHASFPFPPSLLASVLSYPSLSFLTSISVPFCVCVCVSPSVVTTKTDPEMRGRLYNLTCVTETWTDSRHQPKQPHLDTFAVPPLIFWAC